MLPSLAQLCSSDDAAVRALSNTARCLLGAAGLQEENAYAERSVTTLISRLESAVGDDAQRLDAPLRALKNLRDIFETKSLVAPTGELDGRARSTPIDMQSPGDHPTWSGVFPAEHSAARLGCGARRAYYC